MNAAPWFYETDPTADYQAKTEQRPGPGFRVQTICRNVTGMILTSRVMNKITLVFAGTGFVLHTLHLKANQAIFDFVK